MIPASGARVAVSSLALLLAWGWLGSPCGARERPVTSAQVSINAARKGCTVEVDATPAGTTDAQSRLVIDDIEPSDHYVHVRCPDQQDLAYFISPRPGEKLEINGTAAAPVADPAVPELVQARLDLGRRVQEAVRLRSQGRIDEAVQLLRGATRVDPENTDLHRELGITFLLAKDWKRARVEMLEAIHHERSDADAHNGLGYALEKLGDIDGALKEYRIATRLEPDNSSYRQHYLEAIGKLTLKRSEKKRQRCSGR